MTWTLPMPTAQQGSNRSCNWGKIVGAKLVVRQTMVAKHRLEISRSWWSCRRGMGRCCGGWFARGAIECDRREVVLLWTACLPAAVCPEGGHDGGAKGPSDDGHACDACDLVESRYMLTLSTGSMKVCWVLKWRCGNTSEVDG